MGINLLSFGVFKPYYPLRIQKLKAIDPHQVDFRRYSRTNICKFKTIKKIKQLKASS